MYAADIARYRAQAAEAISRADFDGTRQLLRQALLVTPRPSAAAESIERELAQLDIRAADHRPSEPPAHHRVAWKKWLGPAAAAAYAAWKFKWVLGAVFSKGKFLLFGFTKLKTLLSALAFFGVYWVQFGWVFGLGLMLSIYVHEMGHVWVMRRYALEPTAPMFIPFLGAFVASYKTPANVHESARVGIAGPLWGLGGALLCAAMAAATGRPIWSALAHVGGVLNLFNLIPAFIFDGKHVFLALNRTQRMMVLWTSVALLFVVGSPFYLFIAIGAAWRIWGRKDNPEHPDWPVLLQTIGLLVVLGILSMMPALPRGTVE